MIAAAPRHSRRGGVVVDRETLPLPAERKYADPGACNVVASDQLKAEVAAIDLDAAGMGRGGATAIGGSFGWMQQSSGV